MKGFFEIAGYNGRYLISQDGRVLSMKNKIILMRQSDNNVGYCQVRLNGRNTLVHRIVAETFIPNPEGKKYVNHLNGDPKDNRVENLEWCTAKENLEHAISIGLVKVGEEHHRATISSDTAFAVFKMSKAGHEPHTISSLLGVNPSIVRKIIKGEAWNQLTGLPKIRYGKKRLVSTGPTF